MYSKAESDLIDVVLLTLLPKSLNVGDKIKCVTLPGQEQLLGETRWHGIHATVAIAQIGHGIASIDLDDRRAIDKSSSLEYSVERIEWWVVEIDYLAGHGV